MPRLSCGASRRDGGGGSSTGSGGTPEYAYSFAVAFPALSFNRPVDLQSPNDGTNRVFVIEQSGRVFVFADFRARTFDKVVLWANGVYGRTVHTHNEHHRPLGRSISVVA